MTEIVLVTGASSGFGNLIARTLARAGHTVYASMRDTAGRNAPRVAEARAWAEESGHPSGQPGRAAGAAGAGPGPAAVGRAR